MTGISTTRCLVRWSPSGVREVSFWPVVNRQPNCSPRVAGPLALATVECGPRAACPVALKQRWSPSLLVRMTANGDGWVEQLEAGSREADIFRRPPPDAMTRFRVGQFITPVRAHRSKGENETRTVYLSDGARAVAH